MASPAMAPKPGMAPAPDPDNGGGGGGSTGAGQSNGQLNAQNAQAAQQKMAAVREVVTQMAQQLQMVGQKVPEFAPAAAAAIKALQQGLTVVAGNPERTPERQAPPNAA